MGIGSFHGKLDVGIGEGRGVWIAWRHAGRQKDYCRTLPFVLYSCSIGDFHFSPRVYIINKKHFYNGWEKYGPFIGRDRMVEK